MKKRVTSLLLAFCMLLSMTAQNIGYVWAAENPPASVSVTYEGSKITDIIVPQNEKKTVTAVCDPAGDIYDYQWQVLIDLQSDLWVNITGQSEQSLDLSYALLSSVLDVSGSGYVRCAVNIGDETVYSEPVCATISFTPDVPFEPTLPEQPVRRPNYAPYAEDEPDPHAEYAYITVNYIDAISGNELFGAHISKIEAGTTFSEIVHSPTFLGFAPYYYKDDLGKDTIDKETDNPEHANTTAVNAGSINFGELLGGTPVNKAVTVNVYYWAINVPYAVKYFFQNINDDYYTEQTDLYYVSEAKTGTIISDAELQNNSGNPVGFSALYHYPESVAADGSTVFECYYDRNYHYIKFELNGGYGVDPIYARYDTPIVINTPTRPGYTFAGWDELKINSDGTPGTGDGKPDTISSRIGTDNKYYKALWEKADTTYTVIYWLENANDDGYSYLGYNVYPAKAEEEEVNTELSDAVGVEDDPARLATLRFFKLNEEMSDTSVSIKGNGSTVANVYYDRKEYTLKYYYAREYSQRGTTHRQICGNTTNFSDQGKEGPGTKDIADLLSYCDSTWSDVTAIPALNNDNGHYTTGTENIRHSNTDYTYYYFTIKDKYGADLTDEWPIEVLEKATLVNQRNGTKNAYFSAWNPEHHIYYGQHAAEFNGNRTVKGRFQKLDRRVLYEERFGEDSNDGEVRFLAFWTNSCPNVTWDKTRKWVYNIYLEGIDGNMPTTPTNTVVTYDTNDKYNEQTMPSIVGFTHSNTTYKLNTGNFDGNYSVHEVNFYYKRTNYSLDFYNNGVIMEDQHYDLLYEFKIGDTLMGLVKDGTAQPPYPKNLEEGAYYFEGWYMTADCADGSGYIRRYTKDGEWQQGNAYFDKMSDNNIILYANWEPVQHKVRFFQTYDNLLNYEKSGDDKYIFTTTTDNNPHDKVFSVDHGNVVGTIDFPTYSENEQPLNFSGWFYMNNGVKTMFTPADTPVKRDLEVFADWGSQVPQPYRIQYMKYGTKEKIADDTFGYAYQGSTRTFVPKVGAPFNQLYKEYNNGWYPTVSSHSITIKAEKNKDNPEENVYTFYYVQASNLPYMVKYVDKQTGKELHKPVIHEQNSNAVVTERFLAIEGMVPDAFYKRLVLSVKWDENDQISQNPEDNVITFYYTPSKTTAFYAIHHMLQKPSTTGEKPDDYAESDMHTEGTGDIGKEITIKPNVLTGYTAQEDAVVVYGGDNNNSEHKTLTGGMFTFTVKKEGTEIFIYYKLKTYDYTVKYLEHGTNKEVAESKTVNGNQYNTVVEESAIPVKGYTAVDPTVKSLTIRDHDKDSAKTDPNVIIFYYVPKTYVAEYKVAGGIGGTLDNYGGKAVANADGIYHFKGSAPMPEAGFEFVGWYTDEDCTKPVNKNWVNPDNNRLIPDIEDMKPEPAVNVYYAKFRELKGDFTITRSNTADEGNGDQVFVYKVTNKDDPSLIIYVSITGAESKTIHDLRYGTYTVEQVNSWSWRYADGDQMVTHGGTTTVNFNQSANKQQWLNGNSPVKINVRR